MKYWRRAGGFDRCLPCAGRTYRYRYIKIRFHKGNRIGAASVHSNLPSWDARVRAGPSLMDVLIPCYCDSSLALTSTKIFYHCPR